MSVRNAGSMWIRVPQSTLEFNINGSDEYVQVSHSDNLTIGTGDFSISVWVKRYDTESYTNRLVGKLNAHNSNNLYRLYMYNNQIRSMLKDSTSSYAYSADTVTDTDWHHYVATFDRDGGSTGQKLYIDGEEVEYDTQQSIRSGDIKSTEDLYIGCDFTTSRAGYLSGSMCGIQIWSGAALTADEVKQVYNGIDVQTANRVINYKFLEREGTTLEDSSNYSNDGTIVGADWSDRDIRCWNTRFDEGNWDCTIETFLDPCDRNFIARNITPGAVKEMYNILGTPTYWDITYNSGNTLTFLPIGGTGLSGLRETRRIGIKNFSDTFITKDYLGIKIEGMRLDI